MAWTTRRRLSALRRRLRAPVAPARLPRRPAPAH